MGIGISLTPPGHAGRVAHRLPPRETVFRVSPHFKDVNALVGWLDAATRIRRERPEYVIPRKTFPDFALGNFDSGESALGVGPTHQYEGYAFNGEQPLHALLVRGESGVNPLASTLNRCLALHFQWKVPFSEVKHALTAEVACTNTFVKKFFSDGPVIKEFPWVKTLSLELRAAIARHHGYYNWFIDFTVDPSVAAWFATNGTGQPPPRGKRGLFTIIDERWLNTLIGQDATRISRPGFETREWQPATMNAVRARATRVIEGKEINVIGDGKFWSDVLSGELKDKMSVSHHYAPGLEVERMWRQKWCAVEAGANLRTSSFRELYSAELVLARLASRAYFTQSGFTFTSPPTGIDRKVLWPSTEEGNDPGIDLFARAVRRFGERLGLQPGRASGALWAKVKSAS
jgi:hypothetical protein